MELDPKQLVLDPKQLVLDLGRTFSNLADGSVDEDDLVILDSLKGLAEQAASGQLEEILDDPKVTGAFGAAGAIIPILVGIFWPDG